MCFVYDFRRFVNDVFMRFVCFPCDVLRLLHDLCMVCAVFLSFSSVCLTNCARFEYDLCMMFVCVCAMFYDFRTICI